MGFRGTLLWSLETTLWNPLHCFDAKECPAELDKYWSSIGQSMLTLFYATWLRLWVLELSPKPYTLHLGP